jgi:hypothetical protein
VIYCSIGKGNEGNYMFDFKQIRIISYNFKFLINFMIYKINKKRKKALQNRTFFDTTRISKSIKITQQVIFYAVRKVNKQAK